MHQTKCWIGMLYDDMILFSAWLRVCCFDMRSMNSIRKHSFYCAGFFCCLYGLSLSWKAWTWTICPFLLTFFLHICSLYAKYVFFYILFCCYVVQYDFFYVLAVLWGEKQNNKHSHFSVEKREYFVFYEEKCLWICFPFFFSTQCTTCVYNIIDFYSDCNQSM